MGIETSVANRRNKEFVKLGMEKDPLMPRDPTPKSNPKSRGKKPRRRHKVAAASPVQKLYDTCKEVFALCGPGIVPSSDNITKLKAVLDGIKPADVGLNPNMPYFRTGVAGRTPAIRYLHLHACKKFSMGIFCLPPSGVLPLHNHPGMTVFSKLLFGTMHIKSYDWVVDTSGNASLEASTSQMELGKQDEVRQPEVRLAKVKVNAEFTAPCNTSILYPADGGNMHCFTAVTACAVLDVLGPPYSDPDGRHCQYYFDFPFASFSAEGVSVPEEEEREAYAWLQEREKPEDLTVVGEMYGGPQIVDT